MFNLTINTIYMPELFFLKKSKGSGASLRFHERTPLIWLCWYLTEVIFGDKIYCPFPSTVLYLLYWVYISGLYTEIKWYYGVWTCKPLMEDTPTSRYSVCKIIYKGLCYIKFDPFFSSRNWIWSCLPHSRTFWFTVAL